MSVDKILFGFMCHVALSSFPQLTMFELLNEFNLFSF